ncbi:putative protein C11orf65 [Liparis tanakae]|uniref:Uncharacterized protein n=1 Tax=Liparis tanakae TaxID=230148 RepID=A0A4Z2GWW4_9TELE|nr:putative protein C11orf65 [Liparis tanakae]
MEVERRSGRGIRKDRGLRPNQIWHTHNLEQLVKKLEVHPTLNIRTCSTQAADNINFPPNIYYKIFTYRPITDLCASSPKDYTRPGLEKPVARQERLGWYQRTENNSWRLFCSKVVSMNESKEMGANKKREFHYSRLQRQQDVDKWRQGRKIEWLKKM